MEVSVLCSTDVSGGATVVCTDGSSYTTIAAAIAAGKAIFPNLEPIYPASLVVTTLDASSLAPGAAVTFRTNEVTQPTAGTGSVAFGGSEFVEAGFSTVSRKLISNVWITSKKTQADRVKIVAVYE